MSVNDFRQITRRVAADEPKPVGMTLKEQYQMSDLARQLGLTFHASSDGEQYRFFRGTTCVHDAASATEARTWVMVKVRQSAASSGGWRS